MLTQAPLRRCVVILCFGAAGLLIAAEWQMLRSQFVATSLQPSGILRLQSVLEKSPIAAMVRQTRLVIRLNTRQLELYEGDRRVQTFPVAIGQDEWETPVGHFVVMDMRRDPVWQHPITGEAIGSGDQNPLGSRWIGFATQGEYHIGIHGTYEDELIGQAVSHGCVRMRNADIQLLFDQLNIGTPITVSPQ
ncbi:MAG: L,D-transpeptidase [Leptolyngbyaceae cyanobacterium T60_A2020_046]|nr:L,D-transpeptidase [Leptolyngbyaceae cyanobacterium T60_A2020_046]